MRIHRSIHVVMALLTGTSLAHATGHTLANSRLSVTFGDTAVYSSPDADRVDAISWIDSAQATVSDYVASGGSQHCGDPQEFFGQSYAEPEQTYPLMVFGGIPDTWKGTAALKGNTKTSLTGACDTPASAVTKTAYRLFTTSKQINEMEVTRTFLFNASTPVFATHGLRSYVPRVPYAAYPTTIWPNAAGVITSSDVGSCAGDCEVTDWNGRWFADENSSGTGLMVIRSASSTLPALLTLNNDSSSASTLSSVVLIQPTAGWKSSVVETEYLCFYDKKTWPAAARAAGRMPVGCTGTAP